MSAIPPVSSPTAAPPGGIEPALPEEVSTGDKLKAKAFAGLMAGANLAKRGIKAGYAAGKSVATDLHADLQKNERYIRLKNRCHEAFLSLPLGVQAFMSNPTADTLLANPQNLFHVASLLSAINHPERAAFEAAIAGSAAVAMANHAQQMNGGPPLSSAQALELAKSQATHSVTHKYVPTEGSASHAAMMATSTQLQAQRATGQPLNPVAAINQGVGAHMTKTANIATSQAIRQFTGLNVQTNFSQQELRMMANAIKPSDVDMMLRVMASI